MGSTALGRSPSYQPVDFVNGLLAMAEGARPRADPMLRRCPVCGGDVPLGLEQCPACHTEYGDAPASRWMASGRVRQEILDPTIPFTDFHRVEPVGDRLFRAVGLDKRGPRLWALWAMTADAALAVATCSGLWIAGALALGSLPTWHPEILWVANVLILDLLLRGATLFSMRRSFGMWCAAVSVRASDPTKDAPLGGLLLRALLTAPPIFAVLSPAVIDGLTGTRLVGGEA